MSKTLQKVRSATAKINSNSTKVSGSLDGFMQFVREQGVVGLAIGLVLGTAVKSIVDSLVNNVATPLLGLFGGTGGIETRYVCLRQASDGSCSNILGWGAVVSSVISFLIIAAVIYFVVKGLKLDRLDKSKE